MDSDGIWLQYMLSINDAEWPESRIGLFIRGIYSYENIFYKNSDQNGLDIKAVELPVRTAAWSRPHTNE